MSQLRKIQRSVERQGDADEAEVPVNHRELPVGNVLVEVDEPVRGDFLSIPLLGWVSRRVKEQTPIVMLRLLLIRSTEDPVPRGILEVELPIYEQTELATLACLERYGWDGRVWPLDAGWPDSNEMEAANLRTILESVNLGSTLVFPPGEQGNAAQPVTIGRARGAFLMPPLPVPEGDPNPEKLAKLRELCQNPAMLLSAPES
jgi:hypothetical protein